VSEAKPKPAQQSGYPDMKVAPQRGAIFIFV